MGNQTKVTHVAVAGSIASILSGVLSFYQPDLMDALPGSEAAFAVILTAAIAYFVKAN